MADEVINLKAERSRLSEGPDIVLKIILPNTRKNEDFLRALQTLVHIHNELTELYDE